MFPTCADLPQLSLSLVLQCDQLADGLLRIATPFKYPNGSNIDIFLKHDLALYPGYLLSDLGQTSIYLLGHRIKPGTSQKQRQIVQDVCESLKVSSVQNTLQISLDDLNGLTDAMSRLSQACIRVADLSFLQRFKIPNTFQDTVEQFIIETRFEYDSDYVLTGRFGKPVAVDFRVQGRPQKPFLIQTVSSPSKDVIEHGRPLEVFSRWYDLEPEKETYRFITVMDSEDQFAREDDLHRLEKVSEIVAFPLDAPRLKRLLSAA